MTKSSEKLHLVQEVDKQFGLEPFPPKRYVVAVVGLFAYFTVYALRTLMSVAVVAMTTSKNMTDGENGTVIEIKASFTWTTEQKGFLLSSYYYGYVASNMLSGYLATKFGGKIVLFVGLMGGSIVTILEPIIASLGYSTFLCSRILIGFFEGPVYPGMHALWSRWAPRLERTRLATIAMSGGMFGATFAMLVSSVLAYQTDWPAIFYFFGSFGIIFALVWWILIYSTPLDHPTISEREKNYILHTINGNDDLRILSSGIPWKQLFSSIPLIGLAIAHFCDKWSFYMLLSLLPSYMNSVMHLNTERAGLASTLPYLVMGMIVIISGQIADHLRKREVVTTTVVRKIYVCIAFGLQACLLIVLTQLMGNLWLTIAFFTVAVGSDGLMYSSVSVNHLDIAPRYAGVLMGITNTGATVAGILAPLTSGFILHTQTLAAWKAVLLVAAGIDIFGLVVFAFLGSGELQKWAEYSEQSLKVPPNNKSDAAGQVLCTILGCQDIDENENMGKSQSVFPTKHETVNSKGGHGTNNEKDHKPRANGFDILTVDSE